MAALVDSAATLADKLVVNLQDFDASPLLDWPVVECCFTRGHHLDIATPTKKETQEEEENDEDPDEEPKEEKKPKSPAKTPTKEKPKPKPKAEKAKARKSRAVRCDAWRLL